MSISGADVGDVGVIALWLRPRRSLRGPNTHSNVNWKTNKHKGSLSSGYATFHSFHDDLLNCNCMGFGNSKENWIAVAEFQVHRVMQLLIISLDLLNFKLMRFCNHHSGKLLNCNCMGLCNHGVGQLEWNWTPVAEFHVDRVWAT